MIKRALVLGLWAALVGVFALELYYHFSHISFPSLLVPSEDGMYFSARAYQQGADPWAPQNAYVYSNNYGALLPWLAAKLAPHASGTGLIIVLRLLTALAAWAALGIIYLVLRGEGVEALPALAACSAIYAGFLYYDTLSARPDGLALSLYLASVACASRPERWAGPAAGFLAVLGALAKQYALLGAPMAILLFWLLGRRRSAVLTGVSLLASGILLGVLILWASPNYLEGTYYVLSPTMRLSWAHWLKQNSQMLETHAGLAAAFVGLFFWRRRIGGRFWPEGRALTWCAVALAVWLVLAAGPGRHMGSFLRYYQQLFLPVAILGLCLWGAQRGIPSALLALVLLTDAGSMMAYDLQTCPLAPPSASATRSWAEAADLVRRFPFGDYPPIMALQVEAYGSIAAPTDHSRHFYESTHPGPAQQVAKARGEAFTRLVDSRQMPVLVTWVEPELLERAGYHVLGQLVLTTPLSMGDDKFVVAVPKK